MGLLRLDYSPPDGGEHLEQPTTDLPLDTIVSFCNEFLKFLRI